MYRLPSRVLRFLALAIFVMSILPARAQEPVPCVPQPEPQQPAIQCSDFFVATSDRVRIHVVRKVGPQPKRVSVLLIHGTWGDARTWDFPGRSVMDYLAVRGYDAYAVDLRGVGGSDKPARGDYSTIHLLGRLNDAVTVANYIQTKTGRAPVVMGWSEGGVIAGLLAARFPQLLSGVGLLSVAPDGFFVPGPLLELLGSLDVTEAFLPTEPEIDELVFGTDPITGKPTMSPDAEVTFFSISDPDSLQVAIEEVFPGFFNAVPAWGNISVPALVVDGARDLLVGQERAQALFNALGSANKRMMIYPRNSHGWFLEDNHDATMRVLDQFLSQFDHGRTSGEFTQNVAE